uniref:hypothetical protein n=1 Tax=Treponema endosymbiont of Eucomonympha sp. TaxID=1580831 RepID=UPI000AE764BC
GRPLVRAPVLMLLGYGADHKPCGGTSYSWTVTGADGDYEASGGDTRYFILTPKAEGSYRIRVSVTGRNYITGAMDTKTAETTVVCGVKEYKGGFKALSNFAPGQFTEGGNGNGWSLGAWGGYLVWYLGDGVPPRGNKAVIVEGNGFSGWQEPSDIWVSYD